MKIPVIFADGTPGVVNAEEIGALLMKRALLSFRRSDGWVRIGMDPLRGSGSGRKYRGSERRNT
jgi:hypothetical protein